MKVEDVLLQTLEIVALFLVRGDGVPGAKSIRERKKAARYVRIGGCESYFLSDCALSRLALALRFIDGAVEWGSRGVVGRLVSACPGRGRGRLNIWAGIGDIALTRLLAMVDIREQL